VQIASLLKLLARRASLAVPLVELVESASIACSLSRLGSPKTYTYGFLVLASLVHVHAALFLQ
jgi:hypothetical protein